MSTKAALSPSPLSDAVRAVKSGQRSAESLVQESLDRIAAADGKVAAYLSVQGEAALEAARVIDNAVAAGDAATLAKPLLGLPVAVKDNLCTQGVPTTAASKILEGYVPSYDATAVRKLREAGAIIVGKVNMDEFAMGSTTETSAYKVTRNPRNLGHAPGGSSGGSAAAVASGTVLGALGTDTGGSIRQPAAWCGVVGIKPTYGRVSRSGLIAYASSLDCVGPIATCVADAAALLAAIAGPDAASDATAAEPAPLPDFGAVLRGVDAALEGGAGGGRGRPLEGLRVGLISEALTAGGVAPEVAAAARAAADALAALGARIADVSLPRLPQQCAAYYVNALSEASANLARFDGVRYGARARDAASARASLLRTRHDGFGAEVRQRILLGTFSLSAGYADAYYARAQAVRAGLRTDFARAFAGADVLLCPTAPTTAYRLGDFEAKGVASYADDLFTVPASLAGLPALSLPCGVDAAGLPIGVQLIGGAWQEEALVRAAYAYERSTDWRARLPPGLQS
ncbi:Glutamyl-tRNA amidotransferase subunit A [Tribonema minus]|uniref:Glutamyl-tRNA(Gln) amidotransferase subunit A, mitochondrial n=1 Tax=Tribonema minus TaxID=303371 RepID=A0A836CQP8_9STRA|nr:Glutamyl-tRNA amidotransferase subunit A [Tribonema minus]